MEFEWDPAKDEKNIINHKISFNTAKFVFNDPYRIEFFDEEHSTQTEERWNVLGAVNEVLFVVYTERNERIRIISARIANPKEREVYYGTITNGL